MIKTEIQGQSFSLSPEKAMFWHEEEMLIISDLHLGKVQHFRSAGIAVPSKAGAANFNRIRSLIHTFNPHTVLLLGDLFHSDQNKVWDLWVRFIKDFTNIKFDLVMGNHDILDIDLYLKSGIRLFAPGIKKGPFYFSHDNRTEFSNGLYNIFGHIHPAIRLQSKSRDGIRLSCFYFTENYGIMPAFGAFTGSKTIRPLPDDKVFAIVDDEVMDMAFLMNNP